MKGGKYMFKVGDTVQLKSGGPVMTVTSLGSTDCDCTWFDNSTPKYYSFPSQALSLYDMN